MSPLHSRAFGTSELVHKWLSSVERDTTGSVLPGPYHEAKFRRMEDRKQTSRAQNPPSGPIGSNQVTHIDKETHKSRSGRDWYGKSGMHASIEPDSCSGNDNLLEQAVPGKGTKNLRLHENNVEDPGEKYARRPRNKTKESRYDYKDVPEKPSRKRQTKSSVKKRPGAILNERFQAPNVATERLTLKSTGSGFLSKGKTSGNADWKELPDLTFSEMRFLKRKRDVDNTRFQQLSDVNPKKKSGKPPSQDIADFFSQSENPENGMTVICKPSSIPSCVSWSVSPPLQPAASTAPRSSFVAHPGHRGRRPVDEGDDLSIHTSIRPNSSVSNQFLRNLTTNALLHGVDTFTTRERRYYSLEDLKMIARDTMTQSPRHQEAPHGFSILRNTEKAATPLQESNDDKLHKRKEERRMPIVDIEALILGLAEEQRHPATQRQEATYTADYGPQQDPDEPAVLYAAPDTSVGKTHRRHQVQLPYIPGNTRNITMPRKNELEDHLSLLPSYFQSQLAHLSHLNQFAGEGDRRDTIFVPRLHQRTDSIEGREPPANTDERHVDNNIEHTQLDLPLAGEPSRPGHSTQETEPVEAITPISDDMDDFDKNLLRDSAEDFTSGEAMVQGDDRSYEDSQDWPSRDMSSHWFQANPNTEDDEQVAYKPAEMQYGHGPMVNDYVQHRSRFPEMPCHVVDNPISAFSGFSQGQVLY